MWKHVVNLFLFAGIWHFVVIPIFTKWYNGDFKWSFFVATNTMCIVGFWVPAVPCTIIDLMHMCQNIRIQQKTIDRNAIARAAFISLRNMTVVGIPWIGFLTVIGVHGRPHSKDEQPPNFIVAMVEIAGMLLVEEVAMYYFHRMLHTPKFYWIHKLHHSYTSPVAVAAQACHPLEHMIINILPAALGPFVIRAHLSTSLFWFALASMGTVSISHSGYSWPYLGEAGEHNWHHLKQNECFGALGILDTLHGTNKNFVASRAKC